MRLERWREMVTGAKGRACVPLHFSGTLLCPSWVRLPGWDCGLHKARYSWRRFHNFTLPCESFLSTRLM